MMIREVRMIAGVHQQTRGFYVLGDMRGRLSHDNAGARLTGERLHCHSWICLKGGRMHDSVLLNEQWQAGFRTDG